jgi:hypothetical protein
MMTYPDRRSASTSVPYSQTTKMGTATRFAPPIVHPMKNGVRTGFYHRKNSPTSYDSICLKCFRTVSSQKAEDELGKDEASHVCEREILAMLGTDSKTTTIH